ncbi:MAG: DUF4405 domain-containing protein [Sedimentisphaerales bacterium]
MKRTTLNYIVDLIAFVNLLLLAAIGYVIKYVLPPGTGGRGQQLHGGQGVGETKALLSMTRHQWGDIHFYLSILFVALIALHLILHWTWIKNCTKAIFLKQSCKKSD